MNIDPAREKQIREFLLGRLPVRQSEEIEEQLLESDELEELVRLVEDDIIDQYVDRDLDRRDRLAAEKYFLQPPTRRKKLAFANMLRERLRPKPVTQASVYPRLSLLFAGTSAAWILAGLLSMVSVGSVFYIVSLRRDNQMLKETLRAQTELATKIPPPFPAKQRVDFAVADYKSASASDAIEISKTIGLIEGHIPLFDGTSPAKSYTVKIQNKEGKQIVFEPALEPYIKGDGSELIVNIDPKLMSPGTWTALVTPNRKGASTDKFDCTIR